MCSSYAKFPQSSSIRKLRNIINHTNDHKTRSRQNTNKPYLSPDQTLRYQIMNSVKRYKVKWGKCRPLFAKLKFKSHIRKYFKNEFWGNILLLTKSKENYSGIKYILNCSLESFIIRNRRNVMIIIINDNC